MGESPTREILEAGQLAAIRRLVEELLAAENPFYAARLRGAGLDQGVRDLEHFSRALPPTLKSELVGDQRRHPPYGSNLTYGLERYVRLHQTSGTHGEPLRWLDTEEGWQFVLHCWRRVFGACGVGNGDRVFFPFSFGPFLGFWGAFDAAWQMGALALSGGGMSSPARLRMLADNRATVVCCTPTYAIRLGEVAKRESIELARLGVKKVIVAGEPGGSLPAVRDRISELWNAEVLDHHGMTEIGPVTYPNRSVPGLLHVLEDAYFAEVVELESGRPVGPGESGELILTNLGRVGSPLLRYRTGDLVQVSVRPAAELGTAELALEGGILARTDDMVVVRGVNLYPSAVDRVIRSFPEVEEYRVDLTTERSMVEVGLTLEPSASIAGEDGASREGGVADLAQRVGEALRAAFALRVPVVTVSPGTLPRFELKARRWHRDASRDES